MPSEGLFHWFLVDVWVAFRNAGLGSGSECLFETQDHDWFLWYIATAETAVKDGRNFPFKVLDELEGPYGFFAPSGL